MATSKKKPLIDTQTKDTILPAVRISTADKKLLNSLCKMNYGHEINGAFMRKLLFDHFGIKTI